MILFFLSLLPLLLGPILVNAMLNRPRLVPVLNGFVLISIGGIIGLHILPESIEHGGGIAVAAALLGLLLPFIFEQRFGADKGGHILGVTLLAIVGLAIHGTLDGVALAAGEAGANGGFVLALGVVIHRIPAGIAIWWLTRESLGTRGALLIVAILIFFSCLGFGVSIAWPQIFAESFWYILQALLVGFLAHVLLHRTIDAKVTGPKKGAHIASSVGAVLGAILLLALNIFENHSH
jgi:uncharacterized protein